MNTNKHKKIIKEIVISLLENNEVEVIPKEKEIITPKRKRELNPPVPEKIPTPKGLKNENEELIKMIGHKYKNAKKK